MKKLIKFNLLLTAIAVLVVCSAAFYFAPHPDTCKKFLMGIDIGEDGKIIYAYEIECPDNFCFIPEFLCCDIPEKCKNCHPELFQ